MTQRRERCREIDCIGNAGTPESGEPLWVLDRDALREGDLLLKLGGSPFSHAPIWAGNTDFVESVSYGVRN